MSAIKPRKCFSKFMIPIALLEKFSCLAFISRIEVRNMIADSSKPDKLRNVYTIRSTARNVTFQKRKVYYIKIKVIALIIKETNPFAIERCKDKKGHWYLCCLLYSTVVQGDKFV